MVIFRNASLFVLATALFLFSCKGKDGAPGPVDKQIRLPIGFGAVGGTNSEGGSDNPYVNLYKFNKNYYPGVDSVIFMGGISSEDGVTNGIVELVNITDNVVISNSTLQATSPNYDTFTLANSKNIYKDLPNKEITLSFRLRSGKEGVGVSCRDLQLFLYRK